MSQSELVSTDRLLDELKNDLTEGKLSLQELEQLLSRTKIASRQPTTASTLFTKQSVDILSTYGLKKGSTGASKEALRCLANALLLNEPSRQFFVDLGYASDAADRLKQCDIDEEFLCARLLFLLSYNTSLNFKDLAHQHDLADSITTHLKRHATLTEKLGSPTDPASMAMSELLRLLFNIQHFFPDLRQNFVGTLSPISTILLQTEWPRPVLQGSLINVINALLGLDLKTAIELLVGSKGLSSSTEPDYRNVVRHLVEIFDRATVEHATRELEQLATPLCTLLRKVYEFADVDTRALMQSLMLPKDADRTRPLGQGDTFSARLLGLSGSAQLPTLRENISSLLFELSEQDPERFVHNVGYGYASGFLLSHNIAVPVDTASQERQENSAINPITGQTLSSENDTTEALPEMTEEEKEREAERLFVLFERLKATGVVDVKNPVEEYRDKQ